MLCLALSIVLVTACTAAPIEHPAPTSILPVIQQYTPDEQKKAADEMLRCEITPMLCRFALDYLIMRDDVRIALDSAMRSGPVNPRGVSLR